MLVGAQGNVPVIQQSSKLIADAVPLLVAGAKRAAQKNDDEQAKQVLLVVGTSKLRQFLRLCAEITAVRQTGSRRNKGLGGAFSNVRERTR